MIPVWTDIEELVKYIESKLACTGTIIPAQLDQYEWHNQLYDSLSYRRAHLQVIDRRQDHKLYIVHCTVFPHFNDPSPIWGFDAVCGVNKISGAFLDFSLPGYLEHPMFEWWTNESQKYQWHRPRELPNWAQRIFSNNMVAAGNVRDIEEIKSLCELARISLDYYLSNVGLTQESLADYHQLQNRYCYYQKQNPHVIRSMVAMGVKEEKIKQFVQEVLFPEVV